MWCSWLNCLPQENLGRNSIVKIKCTSLCPMLKKVQGASMGPWSLPLELFWETQAWRTFVFQVPKGSVCPHVSSILKERRQALTLQPHFLHKLLLGYQVNLFPSILNVKMHSQRKHALQGSGLVCTSPRQRSGSRDGGVPGDVLAALMCQWPQFASMLAQPLSSSQGKSAD